MIKNLIFDIGDVLLEYRWKTMLIEHGMSEEDAVRVGTEIFRNPHWEVMDLGTVDDEIIIEAYAKMYPEDAKTIEWFITHAEFMHVERKDVWERVYKLKDIGYKIYLLSNYPKKFFEKHMSNSEVLKAVDGAVISSNIYMMKPDRRSYRYLLNTYGLKPEECVFYDDRPENTEAARKLGIEAVTITSRQQLLEVLDERIEKAG